MLDARFLPLTSSIQHLTSSKEIMPKTKEREPGFEESLSALERIAAQLESGDLPLERALELWEEGVGLARRCQSQLEEAERKVELLLRERGEIKTIPFDAVKDIQSEDSNRSTRTSAAKSGIAVTTGEDMKQEDKEEDLDDSIPF